MLAERDLCVEQAEPGRQVARVRIHHGAEARRRLLPLPVRQRDEPEPRLRGIEAWGAFQSF
jgi:hypothetical protein